jgi:hypothetical protein
MTWGYEIKTRRQDWLHDEKWRGYLPFCNAFYLVCPSPLPGGPVIKVEEVPEDCGLLCVNSDRTRLRTQKKAPTREHPLPENFWRELIMDRVRIVDCGRRPTPAWMRFMERMDDRDFRFVVGRKLAEGMRAEMTKLGKENDRLRAALAKSDELGVDDGGDERV